MKTSAPKASAGKRLLIAEDDPIAASRVRGAFVLRGHEVEIAANAGQALAAFAVGRYDLVIVNLRTSHLDGVVLAQAIKSRSPGTPVMLLSPASAWEAN